MNPISSPRKPHAVLDLPSRAKKALKIERLIDLHLCPQPIRLLEIGTGSGGISHYFGNHANLHCDVTAVDVTDQRQLTDGYKFIQVHDTYLPFPDCSFDVVLSNHVIEHVGELPEQRLHLRELHRVLRKGGVGYIAVPNRWMLVEPHYRLMFLSWLPSRLRTPYLRMMGRGSWYDCSPLTLKTLERLLSECHLDFKNLCTRALRETLEIEGEMGIAAKLAAAMPDRLLDSLAFAIPTLIYRLEKRV